MKNKDVVKKKKVEPTPRGKEAEKLFREIGLGEKDDRGLFAPYGTDQASTEYKILFTNNTETSNG